MACGKHYSGIHSAEDDEKERKRREKLKRDDDTTTFSSVSMRSDRVKTPL
jgi:hypothetical protein